MATLKQGSWTYTFTPEDRLWTARMLAGEGPVQDAPAVLWTMAQLFSPAGQAAKYSGPHHFRSWKALIQAYSQPINPIWRRDGSKCRPGGSHETAEACAPSRLAMRDRYATLPYTSVDPAKRQVLERWLAGQVPNPVPGAYEFAHSSVLTPERIARFGLVARSSTGNIFLGSNARLPPVLVGPGGAAPLVGGLALVVGAGALAWFGARWARRRRDR